MSAGWVIYCAILIVAMTAVFIGVWEWTMRPVRREKRQLRKAFDEAIAIANDDYRCLMCDLEKVERTKP